MKTLTKTPIRRILIVTLGILLLVQMGVIVRAALVERAVTTSWSWAYRPETLKEMYELSDMVIVGTVIDVREGPEWEAETTSPDHPTITVNSMLIDVSVVTSLKGEAIDRGQITIYRQVDLEQNSHKIGETYLVFLRTRLESTEATDGSYFVFAAEGNYQVVENKLVWDWADLANSKDTFAANDLDGLQLDIAVQQVESLR